MIVTRFAPSPTGFLHLGHAYAALVAFEAARGGRFLLRIEDIDAARCHPEFERAILEDLAWLGLSWEQPVRRQSEHFSDYAAALDRLDALGVLYPCFCTRKEIAAEIARAGEAPHGPEGPLYPGTCRALPFSERRRRIARGETYALRLDVAKALALAPRDLSFTEHGSRVAADPTHSGDVVLARKKLPASYHLAVVVDDAVQGVTLVTRGEDLLPATHVQRLLQALLGYPAPAYAHHRLILDKDGKKFSKRDSAVTLRRLREGGARPEDIRNAVGLAA